MKKVKIVTAPWCAPCKELKREAVDINVDIEFIDADDENNKNFIIENKIKTVPTLINDDKSLVTGVDDILKVLLRYEK